MQQVAASTNICGRCRYSMEKPWGEGNALFCSYEAEQAVSPLSTCDAYEPVDGSHTSEAHFVLDADENPADEPPTTPEMAEDAIYEFLDSWFTSAQAIEILDTIRKRFEDRMIVELTGAIDDEHADD